MWQTYGEVCMYEGLCALCYIWNGLSLTSMYPGVMEQLDVDIVPYIVLLVVPVLGRMSDPSDSIRFMATQCFATLIRLLPLEVEPHKWLKWNHLIIHRYYNNIVLCCFSCLPGRYTRPSSHVRWPHPTEGQRTPLLGATAWWQKVRELQDPCAH